MGKKYIIELEDENYHQYSDSEPSDYLWKVKGFNALVFDEVGISKLTPYTEPDLKQIKADAYNDGYKAGREAEKVRQPDLEKVRQKAYDKAYADAVCNCSEGCSHVEQVKVDAYLKGLNDGQGVIFASTQNNAFNNGYKKCLEDMEQVRIEAFQEGKKQAKVQAELDVCHDIENVAKENYKAGLSDAWEVTRKIRDMTWKEQREIFGTDIYADIIALSASEAIEKIRQYEQEQKEIKVGDEVKSGDEKYIVLQKYLNNIDEPMAVLFNRRDEEISVFHLYNGNGAIFEKTGRHFSEIAKVLAKMKEN